MHLAVMSPSRFGARTTRALMMCLNASKYSCRVRTASEETTVRVRLVWGVKRNINPRWSCWLSQGDGESMEVRVMVGFRSCIRFMSTVDTEDQCK